MQQSLSLNGGATTVTNYAYNAANQLIQAGSANLTYDSNGNMLNDGTNAYTWDRANRLLSMGGASYAYDGEGRRVKQTVGATVTKYLLDLQPGLSVVLSQDVGGNITRFVHAPTGIFARKDSAGGWHWTEQDALGTVRGEVDVFGGVEGTVMPDPYGNTFAQSGVVGTPYYFTGEMRDLVGLNYHRARYYHPVLGIFPSLDPFEGMAGRPMSLNGYSWVEGDVANATDATGNCVPCIVAIAAGIAAFLSGCTSDTTPTPSPTKESIYESSVRNSTVLITSGKYFINEPNCNTTTRGCEVVFDWSLGVILPYGVISHDHFEGCEGQRPDSAQCNLDTLKNTRDFIEFRGPGQKYIHVPTKDLAIDTTFSGNGFTLFPISDISRIGGSPALVATSKAFQRLIFFENDQNRATPIYFAYLDTACPPTDWNCSVHVGLGQLHSIGTINFGTDALPNYQNAFQVYDPTASVQPGSSGGGNFMVEDDELQLIGITQSYAVALPYHRFFGVRQ